MVLYTLKIKAILQIISFPGFFLHCSTGYLSSNIYTQSVAGEKTKVELNLGYEYISF